MMRAVVERVREASVTVEGRVTGKIGPGMVVLLGIGRQDGEEAVNYLADKLVGLRIFEDVLLENRERSMNRSIAERGGEVLLVSQFTLYGDCRRGRRPSFDEAAPPGEAETLYRSFAQRLRTLGFPPQEGVFGAHMELALVNDGPVTLLLSSERTF
jgi:D-tyrosyl-tRNA(Tyr) deacylase